MYDDELLVHCNTSRNGDNAQRIGWQEFKEYAKAKEVGVWPVSSNVTAYLFLSELWHIFHDELDLDGNGRLSAEEFRLALEKSGRSSKSSLECSGPKFTTQESKYHPNLSQSSWRQYHRIRVM